MEKYERRTGKLGKTKDKKLRSFLKRGDLKSKDAAEKAADAEILLTESNGYLEPENEMEQTYKVKQEDIVANVDLATANKKISLDLPNFGPYSIDYSLTGNYLLLGGRKGHVSSFNWKLGEMGCELQLQETVHDVKYLQNDYECFAVAQKKYVYLYDQFGAEIHQLKHHVGATHLEYLPYHYLLATAGTTGYIKYQDVSTGQLVAELRTKLGNTTALRQNPYNAVLNAGHSNGQVSLWAPNMSTPLVKLLSSRGPVRSISVDRSGNYMAVAGQDKSLKIWDIRRFAVLEEYYSPKPASSTSISASGLLSVGWGSHVQIWKDVLTRSGEKVSAPYMNHILPGHQVETVRFCPFEDILGIGSTKGFDSMIVPGSGEANVDALEINPYSYATRTGRRETQVKMLLEKLQPDTITLNPNDIGKVDSRSHAERLSASQKQAEEEHQALLDKQKLNALPGTKPANSRLRKMLRKKTKNVVDQRKMRIEHAWEREKQARENIKRKAEGLEVKTTGAAMRRFM